VVRIRGGSYERVNCLKDNWLDLLYELTMSNEVIRYWDKYTHICGFHNGVVLNVHIYEYKSMHKSSESRVECLCVVVSGFLAWITWNEIVDTWMCNVFKIERVYIYIYIYIYKMSYMFVNGFFKIKVLFILKF